MPLVWHGTYTDCLRDMDWCLCSSVAWSMISNLFKTQGTYLSYCLEPGKMVWDRHVRVLFGCHQRWLKPFEIWTLVISDTNTLLHVGMYVSLHAACSLPNDWNMCWYFDAAWGRCNDLRYGLMSSCHITCNLTGDRGSFQYELLQSIGVVGQISGSDMMGLAALCVSKLWPGSNIETIFTAFWNGGVVLSRRTQTSFYRPAKNNLRLL